MQRNKRVFKSKLIIALCFLILFLTIVLRVHNDIEILDMTKCVEIKENIGIIDTYLSQEYENVEYHALSNENTFEKNTHGDCMLEFLRKMGYDGKIYYVSAFKNGKINNENVYAALEWLKKQNVTKINISMSSKVMDKDIQNWIHNNKESIQVYSSYNNRLSTISDYPAMYKDVIGSGFDDRIEYKDCDRNYRSNKLLIISKSLLFKTGNSYLSLVSMLKDCINDIE